MNQKKEDLGIVKKQCFELLVMFFIFCFNSFVEAKEQGLVGWWKFDEGKGDVLHDSSGKKNDGVIYGATWVKDKTGYALEFNGTLDNYVNCGNDVSLQIDGPITTTTWVKLSERKDTGHMWFINNGSWNMGVVGQYLVIQTRNAINDEWLDLYGSEPVAINEWVYIAGIYSIKREKMEIYLNGKLVDSIERIDGAIGGSSEKSFLFGKSGHPLQCFIGIMSETKIYNRDLSAEEIKANYHEEKETKNVY